jgi:hypothetical protein
MTMSDLANAVVGGLEQQWADSLKIPAPPRIPCAPPRQWRAFNWRLHISLCMPAQQKMLARAGKSALRLV